ncbi:hypothetical protein [Planctomicrobium piriforme]|uniref:Uncharacterized protein n=1 Tax=Planctomicrobium piriforme TaxID=1576369 RepID=A0A1I3MLK1_9PLAN|nr:hypothetical protein [Planctomicrobium piriforme]SFI97887.1 hypothetical protein SAMN05421753_11444 [Planctomicrobium piriforme]
MRRFYCLAASLTTITFAAICSFAGPVASELFPTAVGTRWVYDAGPVEVTEEIVGEDLIEGERCLKLETRVNGKPISFEHLAVRPDGVYRVTIAGERVMPPLCFLKSSPQSGERWSVKSKVGEIDVSGEFAGGKSLVQTPSGRYSVITAHGTRFQSPGGELEFTYSYAPGVGKVKQVISIQGKSAQLVLKEFHPAPNGQAGSTVVPASATEPTKSAPPKSVLPQR